MNYDDMAHMADQERKREREEFKEENNPTITVPLKQWREQVAELALLRKEQCPHDYGLLKEQAAKYERKREREEDRPTMVTLPFKVWEKERKELEQLRKRVAELEDARQ